MPKCALVIAIPLVLSAQTSLDLTGRYWLPQMSTRIRVDQNGVGTEIDARRDLGMSDTNFPQGTAILRLSRGFLRFDYTPIDYTADEVVNRTIIFRGMPYPVSTRVISELEVKHLQLSWAYQFIRVHGNVFRIGPMLQTDGFLMRGSLAAPNVGAGFQQQATLNAGLPTIGLAMSIQPYRAVEIHAQVSGMEAGSYGYFVGSDSGVTFRAWKHLLLTAGYRTLNLQVEVSPVFARMRLRGPFVGAGVRF
jgi:hypothetical protein